MTLTEMRRLAVESTEEIKTEIERYRENRMLVLMLHGAMTNLTVGLAGAKASREEAVAIGALRGCASNAIKTLNDAMERHPECVEKSDRIQDIAWILDAIAKG